jgi:excisionase family DNA binding protein
VDQIVVLENMAGALPASELAREVSARGPAHNEHAVRLRASIEGISLVKRRRRHPWGDDQDAVIRELAGEATAEEIGLEIRRRFSIVRTRRAVELRALALGLVISPTRTLRLVEVCQWFPIGDDRLREMIEAGELEARRCGLRSWSIQPAALEAFLRARPWLFDWREVRHPHWQQVVYAASLRQGWLSAEQVAAMLGMDPRSVRRLARRGELDGARLVAGTWRVPAEAVAEWIRAGCGLKRTA